MPSRIRDEHAVNCRG